MNESDIIIPEKLKGAMMEYRRLVTDTIYFNSTRMMDDINIGIKDYAKYILREGTNKAKRELVEQLPIPHLLHNKTFMESRT